MNIYKTIRFTIFICLVSLIACAPEQKEISKPAIKNPLLGSWEVSSIHWITSDTTYSIDNAQPGIFIIDEKRYCNMWTPTRTPRVPFVDLSKPTEEEMKVGFSTVVFNAGSYEMTDTTFITTAHIAKVPGFEGGIQYYSYEINGDMMALTMFDETYPNGSKPEWFGKYKTKFMLQKVE